MGLASVYQSLISCKFEILSGYRSFQKQKFQKKVWKIHERWDAWERRKNDESWNRKFALFRFETIERIIICLHSMMSSDQFVMKWICNKPKISLKNLLSLSLCWSKMAETHRHLLIQWCLDGFRQIFFMLCAPYYPQLHDFDSLYPLFFVLIVRVFYYLHFSIFMLLFPNSLFFSPTRWKDFETLIKIYDCVQGILKVSPTSWFYLFIYLFLSSVRLR